VARLKRSAITIKQLAFILDFKDAAYFNRFFARQMGTPPARSRRDNTQRRRGRAPQVSLTCADWP
jgi:AraC family transcriptional regulator, transcriptional activator of pobA